jgi:hypothetical protein
MTRCPVSLFVKFYEPHFHPDDNPPVTAAAFSAWQWNMARFAQQQGAISFYTQAVISCLDPTPLARISSPDGMGTANLTLHTITRLEELYERLPAAVLTLELNKLDMPFAQRNVHTRSPNNAQYSTLGSRLQRATNLRPPKITYLFESSRKFPPFHLALQMYDRMHVTPEQRTFETLATEAEQA